MLGSKLDIFIMPDRVVVQRISRWPRGGDRECERLEVSKTAGGPAEWGASLETCSGLLAQLVEKTSSVVVSDLWARFSLIALGTTELDDGEKIQLARAHFERNHPETRSDPWPIRVAQQGNRLLISALDPGLLRALEQMAASAGMWINSTQPLFAHTFDQDLRGLGKFHGWLIVDEPGMLVLAHVVVGRIDGIHCQRVSAGQDMKGLIELLLNRQGAVLGHVGGKVIVRSIDNRRTKLGEPWHVEGTTTA